MALENSGAGPSPARLTKARHWDSGWHVDGDGTGCVLPRDKCQGPASAGPKSAAKRFFLAAAGPARSEAERNKAQGLKPNQIETRDGMSKLMSKLMP